MKNLHKVQFITTILMVFVSFLFFSTKIMAQKVDVDIEKIKEKCKDKPYEDRVRVTVGRFNVTTNVTTQEFGDNLGTMLKNALHEINCFRVLESTKNMNDMTDEIALGQEGFTNGASAPQSGKMLGAQVVFTGEVTEFNEGNNTAGALGLKFVKNKAKVGFIITAMNPESREIYFTKSVEAEGSKPGGFSGVKLFGVDIAGGNKNNGAIADAVERGIIKAAYIIGEEMDKIPFPKANSGLAENKVWNASNCPILGSGKAPSIMVIVPENYNINDYRNYNFSDLAVESAIIRRFTESGFTVIDPAMFAARRKDAKFNEAYLNPLAAASLGSEFGADIVIVGDASTTLAGNGNNMVNYRARVDTKAINTSSSSIIASNGFDAGAADVSENSASKRALSNAGELMANYIIERLCAGGTPAGGGANGPKQMTTSISVKNTNIVKLSNLRNLLSGDSKVKSANQTAFSGSIGSVEVIHEGVLNDIVDLLINKGSNLCEITAIEGNKLTVVMK